MAQRSNSCGEHNLLVPHKPFPGLMSSRYQLVLERAACLASLSLCSSERGAFSLKALEPCTIVILVQVLYHPISWSNPYSF